LNPLFEHPSVISMQYIFLLGFAVSSLIVLLLKRKDSIYLVAAFPIFVITFHQVDEYLLSPLFMGEKYHFLNWAYRSGVDISPFSVVIVNVGGYLIALLPFFFKPSTKAFAIVYLFGAGILLGNGMFHLGGATIQSDYSPGMLTALFLFLPLYIKSILIAHEVGIPFRLIFALSLYGSIAHFVIIWLINTF